MKKNNIINTVIILIALSLGFISCKESSVDPIDNNRLSREQVLQYIGQKTWILAKSSFGDEWAPSQTNFESDGKLMWKRFFVSDPKMEQGGIWQINAKGDSLTITGKETKRFYISYMDDATLKLRDNNNKEVELWGVTKSEYALAVVGSINNKLNLKLESDYKVQMLWLVDPADQGDYTYIWGQGSIDVVRNRFFVLLNSVPPQATLSPSPDGFKLGVGYVFLSKIEFPEGIVEDDLMENSVIGVINDRSIIYLDNDLPQSVEPEWLGIDFQKGWNFGKGLYLGEKDGWSYTKCTNVEMIIDSTKNFRFPNWK